MLRQSDFDISDLGLCRFDSPLIERSRRFADEGIRVRLHRDVGEHGEEAEKLTFEKAGPRRKIFFDPAKTTAAMVTCGGLAPGLNNVIRSTFLELTHNYGVGRVLGIRDGYLGLTAASRLEPIELSTDWVHGINHWGGTVLGSSRGAQEPAAMVDYLEAQDIDVLFCIGGDGTQRGAHAIHGEVARRGLEKSIVGIPKTIDNDVPYVSWSFGFQSALEVASEVLRGAHVEAHGAPNGIGLVKLMGRGAGFIAAGAAVANQEVNFVLVPEVEFPLDELLEALEARLAKKDHAVVVVAEGAGQHLIPRDQLQYDKSGNVRLADIGVFLRDQIKRHFTERGIEVNLKYIDPSYVVRSVPANAWDRILTDRMARNAVHAAMAGKTDMVIGNWNAAIIHVPIEQIVGAKKRVAVDGNLWSAVLASTGQPNWPPASLTK